MKKIVLSLLVIVFACSAAAPVFACGMDKTDGGNASEQSNAG